MGRDFSPAHTDYYMQPIYTSVCSGSGAQFQCMPQLTGYMPMSDYVPDRYYLKVRDINRDNKISRVQVAEGTYDHPPTYYKEDE